MRKKCSKILGLNEAAFSSNGNRAIPLKNAAFSKKLVDPKAGERWLLVTSAFHMPRAMGVFRTLHFAVEPCPVDWRLEGRKSLTHFPNQADEGLQYTNLAVREWLGLFAYRLAGRIDELLPGPTQLLL